MNLLPNEVLLEIFRWLTYKNLKFGVILCCKRFHSLLTTGTNPLFDRFLFRDNTVQNPPETIDETENERLSSVYILHPNLESSILSITTNPITKAFNDNALDIAERYLKKENSHILEESTTSPTVSKMKIVILGNENNSSYEYDFSLQPEEEAITGKRFLNRLKRILTMGEFRIEPPLDRNEPLGVKVRLGVDFGSIHVYLDRLRSNF